MKKALVCTILTVLLVNTATSYSETTAIQQQPTKPHTANIDTSKQSVNKNAAGNQQNSDSVYDNIRSGWNKFLDFLAGPAEKK